ncbi:MAG: OmpP1/FadL family transporter [Cyclobacteriaceae bacterium]
MKLKILLFTITVTLSGQLWASGFQVLLQGNRQTAMGNVGVSLNPDAYSLFFNPGGLGMMEYNQISVGFNPIFSNNVFWNSQVENSNYTAETDNPMGTPFHFYGVWGPQESNIKFGLGVYTPYGSGVNWGEDWIGRNVLEQISLQAIFIQPTVSYKLADWLSVGGGFVYAVGGVNLQRSLPIAAEGDPSVELDGSANGVGYNVGMLLKAGDNFNFGISYRSRVDMEVSGGDASFTAIPGALAQFFPAGNTFDASLPLPSNLTFGATYFASDKFQVSAEANLVGWSAFDTLAFDFTTNTPQLADSKSPRNYENSWVFKLGGEYKLNDKIALRAGAYFDQTPVQAGYMTPETPDADRLGLTFGIGYNVSDKLSLDLSFLYIDGKERTQTFAEASTAGTYVPAVGRQDVIPGTYELNAFIPGISLNYKF